ncbi:MAG: peroxiredoxin [Leptospiraceae bacterium]|nr:peroxiredoxin [Leptospiraceae bacterium]
MTLLGKQAPEFTLPNEKNEQVSLSTKKGKKVLLVFYPGDETAVCTEQLCSYNSGFEDFQKLGVEILGINSDSVESHKKFSDKYKFSFSLLSDPTSEVCKKYNAVGLFGKTKRSTFLIDESGKIIFENEIFPLFYKDKTAILTEIQKLI